MVRAETRRERFKAFPTEFPGVQLRVEPGVKLDILQRTIKNFYRLAKQFATNYFRIEILNGQQEQQKKEIIDIVKEHEGLRGLISESDNFVLTVIPREKIRWDRELVRKSIGIAYSAVAREILAVNILIPIGFITKKGITLSEKVVTKTIQEALVNLGISKEELAKIMTQEINITIDEDKLARMIDRGQIELLPGAKTAEIVWQIRVNKFKK